MSNILFVRGKSFQRAIVSGYKKIKRSIVLNVTLSWSSWKKKMTKEKGVWDDKGYDKKSLLTVWRNQNNPVYETAKETLMYRTVLWTLWERERVGSFGRMALKHV